MKSNILLFLFSCSVAIIFFEIGVRYTGNYYTHSEKNTIGGSYFSLRKNECIDSWFWLHKPHDTLKTVKPEFIFNRVTNSLGFADKEWVKEDSSFVILGLGDSFTEGTGVNEDSTWLRIMEAQLNEEMHYSVSTMNGGVGGSDPVFEYMLLEDKLLDYRPDMVVLSINSSDLLEISLRGGFERFKEDGTTGKPAPWWEIFYQYSHLARAFVHDVLDYGYNLVKRSEEKENRKRFVPIMSSVIDKVDSLSVQYKFDYLIVFHPILIDFLTESYLDEEMKRLLNSVREAGIPHLDIRERLVSEGYRATADVKQLYWPLDMHFNKLGYELYAKYVSEVVMKYLPDRASVDTVYQTKTS